MELHACEEPARERGGVGNEGLDARLVAIGDGWLGVSDLVWSTMEAGKSIPSILAALAVMLGTSGDIRDVNELGVPDLEDPGVLE